MPSTLLHLGPGLAIGLFFKKKVNLVAILLSSILIDIELAHSLLITGEMIHGALHTLIGATALGLIIAIPVYIFRDHLGGINDLVGLDRDYSLKAIVTGSLLGAWIHVLLDGLFYERGLPIWINMGSIVPWTVNPSILNGICILGFIAGGYIYFKRIQSGKEDRE